MVGQNNEVHTDMDDTHESPVTVIHSNPLCKIFITGRRNRIFGVNRTMTNFDIYIYDLPAIYAA